MAHFVRGSTGLPFTNRERALMNANPDRFWLDHAVQQLSDVMTFVEENSNLSMEFLRDVVTLTLENDLLTPLEKRLVVEKMFSRVYAIAVPLMTE
jgi:transcriptional regulator CtsR